MAPLHADLIFKEFYSNGDKLQHRKLLFILSFAVCLFVFVYFCVVKGTHNKIFNFVDANRCLCLLRNEGSNYILLFAIDCLQN